MIVVTGAYGFIGSCMVQYLIEKGVKDIIVVDDFSQTQKSINLPPDLPVTRVERREFFDWLFVHGQNVTWVLHMGAKTDTAEQNEEILMEWNVHFSKKLWEACIVHNIKLIYASSAATYGGGQYEFSDNHALIPRLEPLNPYAWSKHHFDMWILTQKSKPENWFGLKFFNVYGPNEYHKGRMASIIFHAFNQIKETGIMKLFKSHHPQYNDGYQARDIVYIKDIVQVMDWIIFHTPKVNGIYNVGQGVGNTFLDMTRAVFESMELPSRIQFIDIPDDIRDQYQYYTKADIKKLKEAGYHHPFYSLEEGISDYISNYLLPEKTF